FAALGLVLDNVLQGGLPPSLAGLQGQVFATYATLLLVPSLIIALRLARLNAGMTLHGMLYRRLLQEQDFAPKGDPKAVQQVPRINYFGVSFLMFLLTDLIAGFSAAILALALDYDYPVGLAAGALVVVVWLWRYHVYHQQAGAIAQRKMATEGCVPVRREQWEAHAAGSLEDANDDMITILALVGLIVFSAFQSLSGLGKMTVKGDLRSHDILHHAPPLFALLL